MITSCRHVCNDHMIVVIAVGGDKEASCIRDKSNPYICIKNRQFKHPTFKTLRFNSTLDAFLLALYKNLSIAYNYSPPLVQK